MSFTVKIKEKPLDVAKDGNFDALLKSIRTFWLKTSKKPLSGKLVQILMNPLKAFLRERFLYTDAVNTD